MAKILSFYDLKAKKKFNTAKYVVKTIMVRRKKRRFAVATSPFTKNKAWRALSNKITKSKK